MEVKNFIILPIKIFSANRVFIPQEYLRDYGISTVFDEIVINDCEQCLKITSIHEDLLAEGKITFIRNGLFYLPFDWTQKNCIKPGNFVFVHGASHEIIIYKSHNYY